MAPEVFGTLYSKGNNIRCEAIKLVAKANPKLNIKIEEVQIGKDASEAFRKISPLGLIPAFESADKKYILTECIAIAIYITSQDEKTTLLGKTKQDYASILRWMSFANSHIVSPMHDWLAPLRHHDIPYNKKNSDKGHQDVLNSMNVLEKHLLHQTYLVGERLTLADIFVATLLLRGFECSFDKTFRAEHPNTVRWYETVRNQPIYESAPKPDFTDEAIKYTPPKKEPKKDVKNNAAAAARPSSSPSATSKETEDHGADPKPEEKFIHPISLITKSKPDFDFDGWKRQYSNGEHEAGLPWLKKHLPMEDFSFWRCEYKYNEELTQPFMSNNLIGGFEKRLEASRKYLFGVVSVFGEANDSVIRGAFLIRGQDAKAAFDVAPDYESYDFTKLDFNNEKDHQFIQDMFYAEDKPTVIHVNGKDYKYYDGKAFK